MVSAVTVFLDETLGRKSFIFPQPLIKILSLEHFIALLLCPKLLNEVNRTVFSEQYSFPFPLVQKSVKIHQEILKLQHKWYVFMAHSVYQFTSRLL